MVFEWTRQKPGAMRNKVGGIDGFTINRTGISAPWVQDFFQNGVHHFITPSSPYFNTGLGSPSMPFWQVHGYNPWTLY